MKGRTFWVTLDAWESKPHLRFVISDPDENSLVMVVHMTKAAGKSRIDRTCIISPGEHPRIRVHSYIDYRGARTMSIKEIYALESNQSLQFRENLTPKLLLRIQNGAKISGNVRRRLEPFFLLF